MSPIVARLMPITWVLSVNATVTVLPAPVVMASVLSVTCWIVPRRRSEEHTSELQSLMRISYAVFCLKKQNVKHTAILLSTTHANACPHTTLDHQQRQAPQ